MRKMKYQEISLWLLLILLLRLSARGATATQKLHVVILGEHKGDKTTQEIKEHHLSHLCSVKASKQEAEVSLIYSYKQSLNGFSALLTADEAARLSQMEGVMSVYPDDPKAYKLTTTRSWHFTSLLEQGGGNLTFSNQEDLLRKANYGEDVIVGVIDTGIWPESESFSDEGMGPIPKSWKGTCQEGAFFGKSNCNRKLIGARYYLKALEGFVGPLNNLEDYRSARDKDGHGTHTASIIGGRRVPRASALRGFASGVASGGAPNVRLAIYKVCWRALGDNVCLGSDFLAAIEDAIADGVHVLSISAASAVYAFADAAGKGPYTGNSVALGALHAAKQNIIVACGAGNDGPDPSTVTNVAPWTITVAASSIDRAFPSPLVLGNGMKIEGDSITSFRRNTIRPLVFAGEAEIPGTTTNETTGQCLPGTLSRMLVKGKIVLCVGGSPENSLEVKRASGAATILLRPFNGSRVVTQVLPGTQVTIEDAATILKYILHNKNPVAKLTPALTILRTIPAPFMAPFSSQGPNYLEPNILKPDITAPGLNILAAWSEGTSPTGLAEDNRVVKYNIISGTSMSCSHVSAVAALLRAIHPEWSSAAIRSALMTTAGLHSNIGKPITDADGKLAGPFHYGSGHIQPSKAADPGLVYDATYKDYLLFLCSSGDKPDPSFACPKHPPSPSNLNYPSLAIAKLNRTMTVMRTVTNVGANKSVYSLTVEPPKGFHVEISPTLLSFTQAGEKKNFNITVTAESGKGKPKKGEYSFGLYMWKDGIHTVRSPIVVSST